MCIDGSCSDPASTFAWYQVTNTANAHAGNITGDGNVTVTNPANGATSFAYNITCTIGKVSAHADASNLVITVAGEATTSLAD